MTSANPQGVATTTSALDIILACCRNPLAPPPEWVADHLARPGFDWEGLEQLAGWHGVTPLVYQACCAIDGHFLPGFVRQKIQSARRSYGIKSMELAAEVIDIVTRLQSADIRVIAYKGPVLAKYLYGDIGLRDCCDIDFIVAARDVSRVKDILVSAGYTPLLQLTALQEKAYIRSAIVYEFQNTAKGVGLELHWKDSKHPSLPFAEDALWDDMREVLIANTAVETVCPENLLLLLCAHGTKHSWQQLRYICDVADLLRAAPDMDWKRVDGKARRMGARTRVLTGICLAHELLGAPVPEELQKEIDSRAQQIVAERRNVIRRSSQQVAGYWSICSFNLRCFDTWRARLRYLRSIILSPGVEEFRAVGLPPVLYPLYSCMRLFRLVRRGVGEVFRQSVEETDA